MDKLLKYSIIISFLGILILLLISVNIKPKKLQLKDISEKEVNQMITVNGTVSTIKDYKTFTTITVQDKNSKISVLINDKIDLKINDTIIVSGKVSSYKGKLELIAEKINL